MVPRLWTLDLRSKGKKIPYCLGESGKDWESVALKGCRAHFLCTTAGNFQFRLPAESMLVKESARPTKRRRKRV